MGERSAPRLKRYLPHAVAATAVVIVLPIGVVSMLISGGLIDSMFVSGPVAMLISLGASSAGSTWWKKRRASHELVFSDLMLWGWLRRLRTERRISRAVELLGNRVELPTEQQIEYFKQLAAALEARDPYTHGHTRRVTAHAVAIAERMGLSRTTIAKIRTAAAIHDIGKLNTPREVLNKPGRLNDEEFAVIKRHPTDGAEMAAQLGDAEVTAMVLHHHERLDGTGYPDRLAGEAIPLGARIIAVADTFDAITSRRPYRGASSHKKGMAILSKEAGTQLDPEAVKAFRSHYSGLRGIAIGSLVSSGPGQLLPWRWGLSSAAPLAKSIAAVAVAGALGTTAAGLAKPVPGSHPHTTVVTRAAADRTRSSRLATDAAHAGARGRATVLGHKPASAGAHQRRPRRGPAPSPTRRHGGGATPTVAGSGAGTAPGSTAPAASSPSPGRSSSPGGPTSHAGSTGSGGGSSGGGGSTTNVGPVSVSTTPPSVSTSQGTVTATTPSVSVSPPSTSVNTPVGTVNTPTVTTTPSVTVTTPSLPTGLP